MDVWAEYEEDDNGERIAELHLIEVNPGGRWASSGSSLFEWQADVKVLHREGKEGENDRNVYFRIVSDDSGDGLLS